MSTIYGVPISNLRVMPEEMVRHAADTLDAEDPNNNFRRILNGAEEFRNVGLTPIFLCDQTLKNIMVTTEEKLRKKYH